MIPMVTKDDVYEKLKKVIDFELGVNVVDLGLIYDVEIKEDVVHVLMTLTTPFCPLARKIVADVKKAVESLGVRADVELTFDPPWSPDRISDELKKQLGII